MTNPQNPLRPDAPGPKPPANAPGGNGPEKTADVNMHDLLKEMITKKASDLHLTAGVPPMFRVDGQLLPDFKKDSLSVDLSELAQAALESGAFYIVTCICGYPNCAGIKERIRIDHAVGRVHWQGRILGEEQTLAFDRDEFQAAVGRGIEQLKQLMARHDLEVSPEINKHVYGGTAPEWDF